MNGFTASIICTALIVAGCASSNLPPIDPMTIDYRQLARDHVRDHFPDASKIRDAQIAPPQVMDAQDGAASASYCKGAPFQPYPEITRGA